MHHVNHRNNLVSNREASLAMGPSSQGFWRFTGNHKLRRDLRIKGDSFLSYGNRRVKTGIQFAIYTSYRM